MKKLKTLSLCLLSLILSISIFTGCGPKGMANLSEVDFTSAETVTLEEVSNKFSSEKLQAYPYVEVSLKAIPDSLTSFNLSGRLSFVAPENVNPLEMLEYLNGELTFTAITSNTTTPASIYLYGQNAYIEFCGQKMKAPIMELFANIGSLTGMTTLTYGDGVSTEAINEGFDINQILELLNYLANPQKIVDGNYTYYKIFMDSTKFPAESQDELINVIKNLVVVVGFDGDRLCKFYVNCGTFELSVDFVESATISKPQDPENYIDLFENNLGMVYVFKDEDVATITRYFDTYSISLMPGDSITLNAEILNCEVNPFEFTTTICCEFNPETISGDTFDTVFNTLTNSGFVYDKENNALKLTFEGTQTLQPTDLIKIIDFTLNVPNNVQSLEEYSLNFYLELTIIE